MHSPQLQLPQEENPQETLITKTYFKYFVLPFFPLYITNGYVTYFLKMFMGLNDALANFMKQSKEKIRK